jgi:glucose-1-phosphate adenylyltransferase
VKINMRSSIESTTPVANTVPSANGRSVVLILSDGPGTGLDRLTAERCKAALPFGGKYRLIDFALSSCANSGVGAVGVITQYKPRSLHAHLGYGRPWDLDRCEDGLALLHPYQADAGIRWYSGSADAIYQNLEFAWHSRPRHVLVLSGYEICCVDLDRLIAYHCEAEADLTIGAAVAVGKGERRRLIADEQERVRRLDPAQSGAAGLPAMMGTMVFSADALRRRLDEDARMPSSTHDLVEDVIPRMIEDGDRVIAYHHTGHWSSPQTVGDYWRANVNLLSQFPGPFDDPSWPVRTRLEVRPPARISGKGSVSHSLVCEGCVVEGTVERSVLSPGVYVAHGAEVRDAVVMHDTAIGEGASVEYAILDRDVVVGPGACVIGDVSRRMGSLGAPANGEIAIVGKGTQIPARAGAARSWQSVGLRCRRLCSPLL